MIPSFKFTSPSLGTPRQLVPVRLVTLIADVEVGLVVEWLSNHPHLQLPSLLTAWEFQHSGDHRRVSHSFYGALAKQVKWACSNSDKLNLLPPDHFVYSDELVQAFSNYIDLFISREAAHELGMGLEWNPGLGPFRLSIDQCPDFTLTATAQSKRAVGKAATAQRHQEWGGLVAQIRQHNRALSHSAACKAAAKQLGNVEAETIRRVTK